MYDASTSWPVFCHLAVCYSFISVREERNLINLIYITFRVTEAAIFKSGGFYPKSPISNVMAVPKSLT